MQIQSIQPYKFSRNTQIRECDPQSSNCEGINTKNTIKSIYSGGMTNIAFGNVPISSFDKEIAEQASVLNKLVLKYFSKPNTVNMNLGQAELFINPNYPSRIRIYASGSSKNAAEIAQGFIEKVTKVPVIIESASEAIYKNEPLNSKEEMAIFVSQSGETADTYAALDIANHANMYTFAITNNPDSKIAKSVNIHQSIDAGEEKAVAATKTVTSSIFSLMVLGMRLGELNKTLSPEQINEYGKNFKLIPLAIEYMIKNTQGVKDAAKIISDAENVYYYAKGDSVGAAKEGALKLTETTGKRVIADASGEALHGTFASIKPDDIVLQIADFNNEKIAKSNLEEIVRKRNVKQPIIMQALGGDKAYNSENNIKSVYVEFPVIPEIEDAVFPLFATIRFQQITNEVTKKLGINPDNGGGFLTKYRQEITM